MTDDQKARLSDAAGAAVGCEKTTLCPAELSVAQWAVESGWGQHQPGGNCFGIKQRTGRGRQLLSTKEWFTAAQLAAFLAKGDGRTATPVLGPAGQPITNGALTEYQVQDWFAAYDSLEGCFEDHAHLIVTGTPYAVAWTKYKVDSDLDSFITGVAARYATAPGYAQTLLTLIAKIEVQAALASARTEAPTT